MSTPNKEDKGTYCWADVPKNEKEGDFLKLLSPDREILAMCGTDVNATPARWIWWLTPSKLLCGKAEVLPAEIQNIKEGHNDTRDKALFDAEAALHKAMMIIKKTTITID